LRANHADRVDRYPQRVGKPAARDLRRSFKALPRPAKQLVEHLRKAAR
jgi:hypothetical protein